MKSSRSGLSEFEKSDMCNTLPFPWLSTNAAAITCVSIILYSTVEDDHSKSKAT